MVQGRNSEESWGWGTGELESLQGECLLRKMAWRQRKEGEGREGDVHAPRKSRRHRKPCAGPKGQRVPMSRFPSSEEHGDR